jgi:uncharacterized protein (DUF58 family)
VTIGSRLPLPTRRFALLVLASSGLLLLAGLPAVPAVLIVDGVLLAVLVVDAALAPRAAELRVARDLPDVLALDGTGEVRWSVRNPSRWPIVVDLADELVPSLRAGSRRVRWRVGGHQRTTATTVIRPARRGRFELSGVTLRVTGPFGLGARQSTVPLPATLRVYPHFRSRDEAELRIDKARILEVGLRSASGRGGGTEFDQLREFTIDDESRRIDWAATARAQKTIVRTFRAERNQSLITLLDVGRVMAARVEGVPRIELAMDAAMMLTYVATRLGDRAGMVAFDRELRAVVPPGNTRGQVGRVTEAMYQLEPALTESDYRGAFSSTIARFRRRTMLVILTDLVEQAVGESLLPALPLITRHHVVVVAAVQDPEVLAWAERVPDDALDVYRKAAAVAALAERARTAARLRALGVVVVDAPPGRMAPLLADTYLHVKATGRL